MTSRLKSDIDRAELGGGTLQKEQTGQKATTSAAHFKDTNNPTTKGKRGTTREPRSRAKKRTAMVYEENSDVEKSSEEEADNKQQSLPGLSNTLKKHTPNLLTPCSGGGDESSTTLDEAAPQTEQGQAQHNTATPSIGPALDDPVVRELETVVGVCVDTPQTQAHTQLEGDENSTFLLDPDREWKTITQNRPKLQEKSTTQTTDTLYIIGTQKSLYNESVRYPNNIRTLIKETFGPEVQTQQTSNHSLRLTNISTANTQKLLKITQMGDLEIKVSLPNKPQNYNKPETRQSHKIVIHYVPTELTKDEIMMETQATYIKWLVKPNTQFKNKESLLLVMEEPPESHIYLGGLHYRAYRYKEKPIRCNTCQNFGHTTNKCKNNKQPICSWCAGSHKYTECQINTVEQKCKNCNGKHSAAFTGCPKYQEITDIINIQYKHQITFQQARSKLYKQQQLTQQQHTEHQHTNTITQANTQTKQHYTNTEYYNNEYPPLPNSPQQTTPKSTTWQIQHYTITTKSQQTQTEPNNNTTTQTTEEHTNPTQLTSQTIDLAECLKFIMNTIMAVVTTLNKEGKCIELKTHMQQVMEKLENHITNKHKNTETWEQK